MITDSFLNGIINDVDTYKYTIPEILRSRATTTPNEIAYIYLYDGENDEEAITYKQLDEAATAISIQLLASGNRGERALMLFPPGMEFIKALYGCFYAGVIAVPAYAPRKNRSLDRIKTLVEDSGSTIVVTIAEIQVLFERSFSDLENLKTLNWIITDQEQKIPDEEFIQGASPYGKQGPSFEISNADLPGMNDIALLQYTSGSTGLPKGVMVTHRNIVRNLEFIRQSFSLTPKSVSVSWLPSFHDMGLIDGVIGAVYNGYPAVLMPPVAFIQKPVRWLKAISKYRGTHGGAPNFAYDLCVDNVSEEEREGLDLSCMQTMYCGAEPIRKETFERFIEIYKPYGISHESMYPCYGMAETTLIISGPEAERGAVYLSVSSTELELNRIKTIPADSPDSRFLVGVGHPWIDTKVKIVNPDLLVESGIDEIGEIWVSGSIVTAGYWNKPQVSEETFKAYIKGENENNQQGWLRTGDLGFFHDNELYITGRLKDMIILHGRNYYPHDIEFITEKSHPALRSGASAAFSIEVDSREKLVIVVEVERTCIRDFNKEAVAETIRKNIADEFEQEVHAVAFIRTASIPKTSSGKIQRKACKQEFLNNSLDLIAISVMDSHEHESTQVIDLTSIQAWLMVWIHLKLGVALERIDSNKSISIYGLNSIKAVQLQQDFLQKFGVNIPPYVFFNRISVKELCEKALQLLQEQDNV